MSTVTVRQLRPDVKEALRVRAAQHGRSMEAEIRDILERAVWERPHHDAHSDARSLTLWQAIERFREETGGVDLDIPPREPAREPPNFS